MNEDQLDSLIALFHNQAKMFGTGDGGVCSISEKGGHPQCAGIECKYCSFLSVETCDEAAHTLEKLRPYLRASKLLNK